MAKNLLFYSLFLLLQLQEDKAFSFFDCISNISSNLPSFSENYALSRDMQDLGMLLGFASLGLACAYSAWHYWQADEKIVEHLPVPSGEELSNSNKVVNSEMSFPHQRWYRTYALLDRWKNEMSFPHQRWYRTYVLLDRWKAAYDRLKEENAAKKREHENLQEKQYKSHQEVITREVFMLSLKAEIKHRHEDYKPNNSFVSEIIVEEEERIKNLISDTAEELTERKTGKELALNNEQPIESLLNKIQEKRDYLSKSMDVNALLNLGKLVALEEKIKRVYSDVVS